MTSRDFAYWLQGFFEIANPIELTPQQTTMIKKHLAMVFIHEIDPSFPAEQQAALDDAHGATAPTGNAGKPQKFNPNSKPTGDALMRC